MQMLVLRAMIHEIVSQFEQVGRYGTGQLFFGARSKGRSSGASVALRTRGLPRSVDAGRQRKSERVWSGTRGKLRKSGKLRQSPPARISIKSARMSVAPGSCVNTTGIVRASLGGKSIISFPRRTGVPMSYSIFVLCIGRTSGPGEEWTCTTPSPRWAIRTSELDDPQWHELRRGNLAFTSGGDTFFKWVHRPGKVAGPRRFSGKSKSRKFGGRDSLEPGSG